MSEEFETCPFCNETPRISALLDGQTHVHHSCSALGFRVETSFASKDEAVAAWNTRAPQPAASVDREALVDLLFYKTMLSQEGAKIAADALIAAGMVNRPEAVVRDEALRGAIKTAGGYANLDAHPDEIVKALHALRASLKEALA